MTHRSAPTPGDRSALNEPWMLAALVLLATTAVMAAQLIAVVALSADLKALWVAGQFWDMGRPDLIYPPEAPLFTMHPPDEWLSWLRDEHGDTGEIYPFLYPPLWAVLASAVSGPGFAALAGVMLWVNAGLLAATVALAIRATRAASNPLLHAFLALATFALTPVVAVALFQGQPQILVSFLIVLAIERSRADAQLTAGAALALAAALKLYPAVYVVIWIARGQWRALATFAAVGAGLALMSVGLAGWELHRTFLDTISQIGRTILVAGPSMNFDAVLAQLFLNDDLQQVYAPFTAASGKGAGYWHAVPRPALWSAVENGLLLALLVGIGFAARRAAEPVLYAAIWPATLIVTVLFVPIGWIYYIIPAAAFAPALIGRLHPLLGGAAWFAGALAFYSAFFDAVRDSTLVPEPAPFVMVAGALIWALGFGLAAIRGRE